VIHKPRLLWIGNFAAAGRGMHTISEELTVRLAECGWRIITVSRHTGRIKRMLNILTTILDRRHEYDLAGVEVYSGMAFLWAEISSLLLTGLHKPLVLVLHGGGLVEYAKDHPDRMRRLLKRGSVIVTPSFFLQSGLASYFPNIRQLPNGLEISSYPFRLRHKLDHTLLWLRAFHQTYQPQLAVRVLGELVQEFPDIRLIMVGPDKADGSLEQVQEEARRLEVLDHLSIVGLIPGHEVPAWLDGADIFLNTTLFESFGVSVMEAAACGLPIVTTNPGELPFLWQHGEDALLVPVDDVHGMAEAVRRLFLEDNLAASLSRSARRKAEQYDWKHILPQWEQLFFEVWHG
jgi:glycosyltransferase involved in cell wall biosynthesis